jgi:hypothetical protein
MFRFHSISSALPCVFALAAPLLVAAPAEAQGPFELLRRVQQGGGWISVPVTEGAAEITTDTLPTFGLALEGCVTVWPGHSGTWTLEARDPLNEQAFDAVSGPGEGARFSYQTGPRSVLDVRVRWSEPRDTTLHLWVGLEVPTSREDPCTPRYRQGSGGGAGILAGEAQGSQ